MKNNKFNKFYSKKSVKELLGQLRLHRIAGSTLDKEWYEGLEQHLYERDITEEERKIVEHILSADPKVLKTEEEQEANFKATEISNQPIALGTNKYPALRTIAGIYTAFAWIVGILAIILAIYFGSKGEAGLFIALPTLVVGALIILGVLAVAESIKVLIDIEYNTRQTAINSVENSAYSSKNLKVDMKNEFFYGIILIFITVVAFLMVNGLLPIVNSTNDNDQHFWPILGWFVFSLLLLSGYLFLKFRNLTMKIIFVFVLLMFLTIWSCNPFWWYH